MSPLARRISVPLQPDPVLSPKLVYGHIPPRAAIRGLSPDALRFPLPIDDERLEGRVTFESLDSIRACRGEYAPYPVAEARVRGEWVYEVSDSTWLQERHLADVADRRRALRRRKGNPE